MPSRLALKQLTASDLTFFEPIFRRGEAGNQKSINLNADPLVTRLFPNLASRADENGEIGIRLELFGPGLAPSLSLRRKIVRGRAYKNWRLNGEFVYDPPDQPGRFGSLEPGDLAVLRFEGDDAPEAVGLILLARSDPEDRDVYNELRQLLPGGRQTMVTLSASDIVLAIAESGVLAGHPINLFAVDDEMEMALEDVAEGGEWGRRILSRRRRVRPVSHRELALLTAEMSDTGQEGEALVDAYLRRLTNEGVVRSHKWVSSENAISPYDFEIRFHTQWIRVDVKTTRGPFGKPFHISVGELMAAYDSPFHYEVWRLSDLTDAGASMRRSGDITGFAGRLLESLDEHMPSGVSVDSFSIRTDIRELDWQEEVRLDPIQDEDE